ncbi:MULTISPECIES: hypothetical protein [Streptomyces]|uniref:UL36 very large tegument protein n=2 Tax=Streptomyces TaxID=1883 RepID=A0ABU3J6B1_9ACTN|nr:hypothetical protein [Streptomyces thermodiastaticus]MDT6970591.1 hypothetical protein [Streptomyces thermocarboxydus]WSB44412.1 hypothetical protein OG853_27685 [Streptomyces cellulosae]WTF23416.1 hypothetical protein OH750_27685 [Streptomyces cellulosae]
MAAEQLPEAVREFTDHLRDLLARLDRYAGWCLVFWQRDPDGMRACLEGREPPPWDVVESLLQDLAAVHGPAAADAELPRSRALHAGATAAFDARPGARQALSDRLDVMLREQRYAADRRAGLTRRLAAAATREEAESLGNDLAWAEDDHRRATARCAEITARMAALDEHTPGPGPAHTQTRWAASPAADAQAVAGPQGPHMTSAGQGTGPNPAPDGRGITESPGPARTPGVPQAGPAREGHGPASVPGHRYAVGGGPNPVAEGRGSARTPGGPHAGLAREGRAPAAVPDHRNGGGAPASAPDGRGAAQAPGVPQVGPARQGHGPAPDRRPAGGGPYPARDGRGPAQAPGAPQAGPGHDETAYLHGRSPEPSHRRPGPENPAATGRDPLAAPEPHAPSHSHPLPPDPVPPELRAAQQHVPPPAPAEETRPSPPRKRRRGGARFAGVEDDGAAPLVAPSAAVPELPGAATVARGARFAGAAAEAGADEPPPEERVDAEDLREVGHLVRTLTRLRREGRSGDAHVLLNEAAYWPAVRLPLLAAEMERAGLGADWATLLWEAAATLPAERLVGAADALAAGGRAEDGEQILRQGVVRPADEIGHAALALADGTRHRELRALLDACVRTRTPQDAARTAAPDPGRLVPLLLTAARAVSEERHWDVLHALRVAGLAA